jgi:hypothetical protein
VRDGDVLDDDAASGVWAEQPASRSPATTMTDHRFIEAPSSTPPDGRTAGLWAA